MARLTTNQRLDFDAMEIWYGVVTEASATRVTIEAGDLKATYGGRFSYDAWGDVYGRVETYQVSDDRGPQLLIDDIGRDAYRVNGFLGDEDVDGLMAYVFSGRDEMDGSRWRDRLRGFDGADRLRGDEGDDRLYGGEAGDRLAGEAGNDRLYGDAGRDRLYGGEAEDRLSGGVGKDRLYGDAGRDTLYGGEGDDVLAGGRMRDMLWGGEGADSFRFEFAADAGTGSGRDQIRDFSRRDGDTIDLAAIDADVTRLGDQEFDFIGAARFSGDADELRYIYGRLMADIDGDGAADLEIEVGGEPRLTTSDFEL